MSDPIVHKCPCGAQHTAAEFDALAKPPADARTGVALDETDDGVERCRYRTCACGSSRLRAWCCVCGVETTPAPCEHVRASSPEEARS